MLAPLQHLRSVTFAIRARVSRTVGAQAWAGWSGECSDCCRFVLSVDAPFRETWIECKRNASRPPVLRRVEWRFEFEDEGEV
jgi:hypothetical protein